MGLKTIEMIICYKYHNTRETDQPQNQTNLPCLLFIAFVKPLISKIVTLSLQVSNPASRSKWVKFRVIFFPRGTAMFHMHSE